VFQCGLRQAPGTLLTVVGAGQRTDLQFHQPFGGKPDHLAQQIGVGGPSGRWNCAIP